MKGWWLAAAVVAIATIAAEIVAPYPDPRYWWHAMPGFDLAYGWIGCVVIVVLSKALGKRLIQRPESYAPEGADPGAPQ